MMKKNIMRLTALTLTTVMALAALAGCGSSKKEKSTSDAASTSATSKADSVASKDGDKMTISVLGIDWGTGPLSNSDMEKYWEDFFDVTLDIEWVNWEDYDQKLNTMIASGSFPDVVQIDQTQTASYYYPIFTQAIDSGLFVDLNKYLFNSGKGVAETNAVMKEWPEEFWDQATYNDGIYILPRSKSESATGSGIQVRRDLMKKYGYEEEPKTMDELKEWLIGLSKAATDGEGKKTYALEYAGDNFLSASIKAYAIAFTGQSDWRINEDGEFEYIQFNDKYIDFLNWMKDLFDAGAIDPEFALNNVDTSKWKSGNSVSLLAQWYNWNQSADLTSNKVFDESTPDTYEAWGLMPVEGPEAYTISPNYSDIDQAIAINAKCSEEKIQKILDVFNATDEKYPGYMDILLYGVKDMHYTLLEDGTKDTTDDKFKQARQDGYVGGWNQIFLKTDADQITDKFMRDGAKRASDESITRVTEIKDFITKNLEETGMKNAAQNLQSATYNTQWSILTDDVNTMCTQYIMGQIGEDEWKTFVKGVVDSADYKAVQKEFKEAADAT